MAFQSDYEPPVARPRRAPRTGAQAGYDTWLDNEQALYQTPAQQAPQAQPPTTYTTNGYAQPGYTAQPNIGAPAGWDPQKWADNSYQSPKYAVGRILGQYQPNIQSLQNALPEIQQAYPGATFNGKDLLTIPGVGTIDVLRAASTGDPSQMGWWWGDTAATVPAEAAGGGAGSRVGDAAVAGATSPIDAAYQAQLLRLLSPGYTDVGAEDVAPRVDVYRAEAERARRSRRDAEMEALGAKGLSSSGAADASLASGYDDMSRGVAGYAADAVYQEQQARRNELMSALEMAQSMGMQQEARDLQWQIAQLDATLTREGRAQQGQQFNDTLGWNMYQYGNMSPWQYYQLLLNS